MKTAIAIFVKTPSLSPVKTRLAADIGKEEAESFYRLCLKAVERTVNDTNVFRFWAVGEEEGLSNSLWSSFEAIYTGEGGLGERQHHIYETLLSGHEHVLLIGADTPQISPVILGYAMLALNDNDFVIGPARDGGYYLFGGRMPLDKEIWRSVPWSSYETRERLEAALPSKPFHLPLLTDVDTQDDLQYALQEMPENISEEQRNIIAWVGKDECVVLC